MSDVRSLLRNERQARRIRHPHAFYSKSGALVCRICSIQLKSDAAWDGHLRSAQHAVQLQKLKESADSTVAADEGGDENAASRKRKATDDQDDHDDLARKKTHLESTPTEADEEMTGVPTTLEAPVPRTASTPRTPGSQEIQLPSRPATPHNANKQSQSTSTAQVDEDEWAAFEADIAAVAAPVPVAAEATISAPALTAAEIEARSQDELNVQRSKAQEKEMEGDREDAARKLEEEFDEMENLEERVKKLKAKREALRARESNVDLKNTAAIPTTAAPKVAPAVDEEDDEEDDDDDDDWDGFRIRG